MFTRATQCPPRYQSEKSSLFSQSENCGVTAAAAIADFYWDEYFPIEAGRSLISGMGPYNVNGAIYTGCPPRTPTNAFQQRDILIRRGIPSTVVKIWTTEQLHQIVDSGRRPMILGLNFAYVPDSVAGHTFQGWHAIELRDGSPGQFIGDDSNFWSSGADRYNGNRPYSDSVIQFALNMTGGTVAVVPNAAKVVSLPSTSVPPPTEEPDEMKWSHLFVHEHRKFTILGGSTLYKGPGREYPEHLHSSPSGMLRVSFGHVELPSNAGLWYAFEEIDGKGIWWAANSRVKAT